MVNGTHRFLGTWVLSNTRKGDYFKFQGLDLSSHLAVLKYNNIYSFIGIVFYEYFDLYNALIVEVERKQRSPEVSPIAWLE